MVEAEANNNSRLFTVLDSKTLDINCDCVSFCRTPGYEHLMLLGLYELNEATKAVAGGFILYDTSANKLNKVFSWTEGGVYDIKWINREKSNNEKIFFLSASLDSYIRIFSYKKNSESLVCLEKALTMKVEGGSERVPLLYVDAVAPSDEELCILTCCEDGSVIFLRLNSEFGIVERSDFKKHEFTAWCAVFAPFERSVFLSGSDDNKLVVYDKRMSESGGVAQENRRTHTMGICCITFLAENENNFYTGSFDEQIRLWDVRNIKTDVGSQKLDGGLWRIVLNKKSQVLTANFTANTVNVLDKAEQLPYHVRGVFDQHTSLTYGLDASSGGDLYGSCSFYDKTVKLWTY